MPDFGRELEYGQRVSGRNSPATFEELEAALNNPRTDLETFTAGQSRVEEDGFGPEPVAAGVGHIEEQRWEFITEWTEGVRPVWLSWALTCHQTPEPPVWTLSESAEDDDNDDNDHRLRRYIAGLLMDAIRNRLFPDPGETEGIRTDERLRELAGQVKIDLLIYTGMPAEYWGHLMDVSPHICDSPDNWALTVNLSDDVEDFALLLLQPGFGGLLSFWRRLFEITYSTDLEHEASLALQRINR
ncbi:hypothetical protein VTO42DRAFT_8100 [Malbranchea cinnamomea]